jgi:cell division protease FtsH
MNRKIKNSNDDDIEDYDDNYDNDDNDDTQEKNDVDNGNDNGNGNDTEEKNDDDNDTQEKNDVDNGNDTEEKNGSFNFFLQKQKKKTLKSLHFEVVKNYDFTFKNIGGYDEVKNELMQIVDIMINYKKYNQYNVRTPKGLILEGPPGNGKTLITRGFSGETNIPFISVSGSEFQDKYVGVGASKVRELFELANKNTPCIIFIDEIDALGRKRSTDGEISSSEKDSTLNELLVGLDGFKRNKGIFVIGATNRIDLLDSALIRPGRIDKKIYMGLPDSKTRKEIIKIHINGKPYVNISQDYIVTITEGLSGAEIENLLNEAMLNALRNNKTKMSGDDIDLMYDRMVAGWQSTQHELSDNIVEQICVHEIGHVLVGLFSLKHPKIKKVVLNLNSPNSPGYTIFEKSISSIFKNEELFEHLMILLGGRIAEEIVYNVSVTTGASNDFYETFKLAEKMITQYGFGNKVIYSLNSDKTKEIIDNEIMNLIDMAYKKSKEILLKNKNSLMLLSTELKKCKKMNYQEIVLFISNISK